MHHSQILTTHERVRILFRDDPVVDEKPGIARFHGIPDIGKDGDEIILIPVVRNVAHEIEPRTLHLGRIWLEEIVRTWVHTRWQRRSRCNSTREVENHEFARRFWELLASADSDGASPSTNINHKDTVRVVVCAFNESLIDRIDVGPVLVGSIVLGHEDTTIDDIRRSGEDVPNMLTRHVVYVVEHGFRAGRWWLVAIATEFGWELQPGGVEELCDEWRASLAHWCCERASHVCWGVHQFAIRIELLHSAETVQAA